MKALLLAAGRGERLKPLTNTIPKCLVPINGKPLLGLWLENLSAAGVDRFLINTHYLKEQVEAFVAHHPFRDRITLAYEPALLGTAGTISSNRSFWENEKDVLVIHADNVCDCDLNAFIAAHKNRPAGCTMTMMTFVTDTPSTCGIVELDGRGVVTRFHEKVANPPSNLANAAVYICSVDFLKSLTTETDLSLEVIPSQLGKIFTWQNRGILQDIGTPEAYRKWKQ